MKPWTTRAILLSVLTACLLSGADARSLLEDSEELGDDDYQASKRELDLSNTLEDSEEQEGALENKRALEAEDSGDSDAELDSDGLKGERELGDNMMEKRADMDSEVVLTQSMVVKKDALSKRYYRTYCYYSICARVRYRCYYAHHYHYYFYYRHGYRCARHWRTYRCRRCQHY